MRASSLFYSIFFFFLWLSNPESVYSWWSLPLTVWLSISKCLGGYGSPAGLTGVKRKYIRLLEIRFFIAEVTFFLALK